MSRLTQTIRIRETRTVTLEVKVDFAARLSKEQIIALVEKQKNGLSLSDRIFPGMDEGQPLHDDKGNEVAKFGEIKVESREVEILPG
jgi:hypothetical protein